MPFHFSFTASAAVISSTSVNGRETTQGVAYRREAYSNQHGTGVRITKQKLGEDPVVKTRMYDADGRLLLMEGDDSANKSVRKSTKSGRRSGERQHRNGGSIIDITEVSDEEGESVDDRRGGQRRIEGASGSGSSATEK